MNPYYSQNNSGRDPSDLGSWVAIILSYIVFWPLGIYLTIKKFSKSAPRAASNLNRNTPSAVKLRCAKYAAIAEGQEAISISYLASAVGVPYNTALYDIQQMLANGAFGNDAYINYISKMLVLKKAAVMAGEKTSSSPEEKASRPAAETGPKTAPRNGMQNPAGKFLNGAASMLLLILGILLTAIGGLLLLLLLVGIPIAGEPVSTFFPALLFSAFITLGGISIFGVRSLLKKREFRAKQYTTIIGEKRTISLKQLADTVGTSVKTVRRDLEAMLEKNILPSSAYLDSASGKLVLFPGAEEQASAEEEEAKTENQYYNILREIRELNDAIADAAVSDRIYQIEEVTAKIFRIVEEKPEKLPQIKSFMSYYLPVTLKLLRSYSTFEKQGITGENIEKAKGEIERVLDTLSEGFSRQLDQLFQSDVIDISSDIDVLENMLKKDGLTEEESPFKTTSGL